MQTTRKIFAAGDQVTMHCKFTTHTPRTEPFDTHIFVDKYDDASKNYTQTVIVNGAQSATLATSDGVAQGWGSAVECAATNCGTVPAHCKLEDFTN